MTSRGRLACLSATVFACAVLAACTRTSGSSDAPPPPPPPPPPAATSLTLSLAGGRQAGFQHVWVTIVGVALGSDASAPYDPTSASWTTATLDAPRTIDLVSADATNGVLTDLLTGQAVVAGTYPQVRLLLADPDAAPTASAAAAGATWNQEVDYVDGGGHAQAVPLEIAGRNQGILLQVPLTIAEGGAAYIAVEWDAATTLARRASPDGIDRFTLRPLLRAYDRTRTGAMLGVIDASLFCTGAPAPDCIDDVTVSAQAVVPGGTDDVVVRSAQVVRTSDGNGAFFLYPLIDATTVDLVVRGHGMDTILVRDVNVQPVGTLATVPTIVGTMDAPLVPVLDTAQHDVALASPTQPAATQAVFRQTPGASAPAIEVARATTDPATGAWVTALSLPAGPLHVATYDKVNPLVFATVVPAEGNGGALAQLLGPSFTPASGLTDIAPSDATWTPPILSPYVGLATGHVTVTLTGTSTADHAELLMANDSGVVSVTDVSGLLVGNGTVVVDLPAGTIVADPFATIYTATLRTWRGASMAASLRHSEAATLADLRTVADGAVTIAWPQ